MSDTILTTHVFAAQRGNSDYNGFTSELSVLGSLRRVPSAPREIYGGPVEVRVLDGTIHKGKLTVVEPQEGQPLLALISVRRLLENGQFEKTSLKYQISPDGDAVKETKVYVVANFGLTPPEIIGPNDSLKYHAAQTNLSFSADVSHPSELAHDRRNLSLLRNLGPSAIGIIFQDSGPLFPTAIYLSKPNSGEEALTAHINVNVPTATTRQTIYFGVDSSEIRKRARTEAKEPRSPISVAIAPVLTAPLSDQKGVLDFTGGFEFSDRLNHSRQTVAIYVI